MNKNSGKIIDRITEGVQSPDDLVFGPDGSLYWTDLLTGEVGRRTPGPNGIVTSQEGDFTKFPFLPGVNPIAFNDEGRLFIALDFQGDGLYEFDPELKFGCSCPSPLWYATSSLQLVLRSFSLSMSFSFSSLIDRD